MSIYVYAEKSLESADTGAASLEYVLRSLEDDMPVVASTPYKALMMSRMDFDLEVTELPPIAEADIPSFLKYRIRSLYPGDPDDVAFDYAVQASSKGKSALLFITGKNTIARYRQLGGRRDLFLPYSLAKPLLRVYRGQDHVVSFWHPRWIDVLVFKEGCLASSTVITRQDDASDDMDRLRDVLPGDVSVPTCLALCRGEEEESIAGRLQESLPQGWTLNTLTFEETLHMVDKRIEYLFKKRRAGRSLFPARIRIPLEIALIALLLVLNERRLFDEQSEYYSTLKNTLALYERQTTEVVSLSREVDQLSQRLADQRSQRSPAVCDVLSEIAATFGSGVRVRTFIFEAGFFQIDGEATNPLGLMESFKKNPVFRDVKLIQTVPTRGSANETFKMTGIVSAH